MCGPTNWLQKWKEVGPCAQNMLTIQASIVNMIGGTYMTTQWSQELQSEAFIK